MDLSLMVDELLYYKHKASVFENILDSEFKFIYNTVKDYYGASLVHHYYTEKGIEISVMISEPKYRNVNIVLHFWELDKLYNAEDMRRFLDEMESRNCAD